MRSDITRFPLHYVPSTDCVAESRHTNNPINPDAHHHQESSHDRVACGESSMGAPDKGRKGIR